MSKLGKSIDHTRTVHAAWGEDPPEEVLALARACLSRGSQANAARAIGYSNSAVSSVLSNKYKGSYEAVFASIRAAFIRVSVDCPALLQTITGAECSKFQQMEKPRGLAETKIYRRCRSGCPHSQLASYAHVKKGRSDAE